MTKQRGWILVALIGGLLGVGCSNSNEAELGKAEAKIAIAKAEAERASAEATKSELAAVRPKNTPSVETGTVSFEFVNLQAEGVIGVLDGDEYRLSELIADKVLPVGEHHLEVRFEKRQVARVRFDVEAGKRKLVAVVDPSRKAAEWVLGIGGTVRIESQGRILTPKLNELPAQPFQIKWVGIMANRKVRDSDLEIFADVSDLEELEMWHNALGNDSLKPLAGLTNLRHLSIDSNGDSKGKVDDAGIAHLKPLTKLTRLNLAFTKTSDAGIEALQGNTGLQFLKLDACPVTDQGLARLGNFTELRELLIYMSEVSDAGMIHLKRLQKLEFLSIGSKNIVGEGFDHLRDLPKLTALGLAGECKPSIWKHVGRLEQIQVLNMNLCPIDDQGVEQLKGMKNLTTFVHGGPGNSMTDAGLRHLLDLPMLTVINVAGQSVTPEGLAAVRSELAKRQQQRKAGN